MRLGPADDFRAKPKFHPTLAKIKNGLGHIAITLLVLEHGIAVREPEDLRDALGVEQVFGVDSWRHEESLHR